MNKLDLRHVCAMMPHGVKFISELDKPYDEFGQNPIWTLNGISEMFGEHCLLTKENNDAYPISKCKLLLLPLSALTEQLPDGTIPIVELAKMHDMFTDELFSFSNENDGEGEYFMCHYLSDIDKDITCHFVVTDKCEFQANALFHNSNPSKYQTISVNNQVQLFEYLYSKHFDIYGLIPLELAKDKRKPYKL